MTERGAVMASEIAEQPDVLARLLTEGRDRCRAIGELLRERSPRFVLFAARGTSDHAALYPKYLVEIRLGLPAGLMSPSSITAYGATPDLRDVLVVALSQSGGSPDLVSTIDVARRQGAITLALTNTAGSALAEAAEMHVDVLAGPERAVAATKSYSAELLASWLIVDAWAGGEGAGAEGLVPVTSALLARRDDVVALADRFRFAERMILTGRGFSYPTAREAALKLMETSYFSAHAFSGADLLHGPLAMIDSGVPVIAVASGGAGGDALRPVLELLVERSADLTVIGNADSTRFGTASFEIGHALPEELNPLAEIVPLQLLALEMAMARGHDPDAPRGLSKVTRTW